MFHKRYARKADVKARLDGLEAINKHKRVLRGEKGDRLVIRSAPENCDLKAWLERGRDLHQRGPTGHD